MTDQYPATNSNRQNPYNLGELTTPITLNGVLANLGNVNDTIQFELTEPTLVNLAALSIADPASPADIAPIIIRIGKDDDGDGVFDAAEIDYTQTVSATALEPIEGDQFDPNLEAGTYFVEVEAGGWWANSDPSSQSYVGSASYQLFLEAETAETQLATLRAGNEFQINTDINNSQRQPSVTGLNDGGFVVTWESWNQDGDGYGIYGQRFDSSGTPIGNEFQINTYTDGSQSKPSMTALSDGGFVVTWESWNQDGSKYGIFGQRFDGDGNAVGEEFQINTYTDNDQESPSITGLNDGGFVVTWQSNGQDGSSWGIYGQRFDSNGNAVGEEFQINTYTVNLQVSPSVIGLSDGGFVVTWQSNGQDGSSYGIYGQRFDSNGNVVGEEFQINTYTDNSQRATSVTALSDGGFVVTWESNSQDGDGYGIYGQRYDSDAISVGNEFQINTYTDNHQLNPSVRALSNGGFVVTWQSNDQDGWSWGIYGQRFDSNGNAVGEEFQINTYTDNDQESPSITALSDGGFVVTWQSNGQDGDRDGIYGQRFKFEENQAPVLDTSYEHRFNHIYHNTTLNYGQTVAEIVSDGAISDLNGNYEAIAVVGVDNSHGNWQYSLDKGEIWLDFNDPSESSALLLSASNQIRFVPNANYVGTANISFRAWDRGVVDTYQSGDTVDTTNNGGNTLFSSGIDTINIEVAATPKSIFKESNEFQVNTYTNNSQSDPSITGLKDGGFVITWTSWHQDGSFWGIYGQRFDSNGTPIGNEFQINSYTDDNQIFPSVTGLKDGGFVVAWTSEGQDGSERGIYGQRYDNEGNPVSNEFQINTYTNDSQDSPLAIGLDDGGFVVTWRSYDDARNGTYGQRYDNDGNPVGNEFEINPDDWQYSPSAITLNDGGFVITWHFDGQDDSEYDIYGQRYDNDGNPVGNKFQVNTYTNNWQRNPSITGFKDGGFVVTWESWEQDGSSYGIYAQEFDSNGTPIGNEFQINTYTNDRQQSPLVTSLDDGFVVTWVSDGQDGSSLGIYGQRFKLGESQEAPILDSSYDHQFNYIYHNSLVSGQTVAELINEAAISDANGNYQEAIAVVGVDNSNGNWQYSLNEGGTWIDFNNPSESEALLLGVNNQIRFIPNADYVGTANISFRAWDIVVADNYQMGATADTTNNGGSTVFSSDIDTIEIEVKGIPNVVVMPQDTIKEGNEFQVNTYTDRDQVSPSITGLSNGGFVVTWAEGQYSSRSGIFGQQYDNNGAAVGNEFRINSPAASPSATSLNNGGFVVTWQSQHSYGSTYEIYGQRYNSDGDAIGEEFQINTYTDDDQIAPSVTALNNGGFVVTWYSEVQSSSQDVIYGRLYDNNGAAIGNEFQISSNSSISYQHSPASVIALNNGGFVVAWRSGSGLGIYGQRFNSNGTSIGNEFQINTYTDGSQNNPSMTALSDGGFVVTWTSPRDDQEGYNNGIYGQRFDSNGTPIGNEFQINTYTDGNQEFSSVIALNNGGFVVAWQSWGQDGDRSGIYGQRFDSNGNAVDGEFLINTQTTWEQEFPSITALNDGGFVVAWQTYGHDGSGDGIFGQRYKVEANQAPVLDTSFEHQFDYIYHNSSVWGQTVAEIISDGAINDANGNYEAIAVVGVDNSNGNWQYSLDVGGTWLDLEDPNESSALLLSASDQIRFIPNTDYVGTANISFRAWDIAMVENYQIGEQVDTTNNGGNTLFSSGIDIIEVEVKQIPNDEVDSKPTVKVGGEFRINTYTNGYQADSSTTALSGGGFVVTWTDGASSQDGQDGSVYGIYGQRFDSNGNRVGNEFRVNTYTEGEQDESRVAALKDGGFIITWSSGDYFESDTQDGSEHGIFGQRFDSNGNRVGDEFQINTYTDDDQENSSVTGLKDGGFVVTWESYGQDFYGDGLYGQRYDHNGDAVGDEFQISYSGIDPSVTALNDGGFIVIFSGVYGQRYDSEGNAIGNTFQINSYTEGSQYEPTVTALKDGGFVVAWTDGPWNADGQDGSGPGIFGQRFDSNSTLIGNEFQINTYINQTQRGPSITALEDGGFVVTWTDGTSFQDGQDGSGYGIYGQRYDRNGNTVGGEFQVNTLTNDWQVNPSVTAVEDGGFVVTWTDGRDDDLNIYGQRFELGQENRPPTDITLSNTNINENKAINTLVGTFTTTDPDTNETFTYSLVSGEGDTDNSLFTINGNILRTHSVFDYEAKNSYTIRVQTTDSANKTYSESFTININDVNENPTDISLSSDSLDENNPINATIGTFSTIDPDAGETFTYQLVSGIGATDNYLFTIDGNVLKTNVVFDFENKASYSIRVQTRDSFNNTYSESLTINVGDVAEDSFGQDVINEDDDFVSLREAIINANNSNADTTITLEEGTYFLNIAGQNEDSAITGDLDITLQNYTVTIEGQGKDKTILDANGLDRFFEIHTGATVILSGVTILDGAASFGGAIANKGNLTIIDSNLKNNQVLGSDGENGADGADGSARNGNPDAGEDGTDGTNGENAYGGGILNSGTLTIQNSQLNNNQAISGYGGDGGNGGNGSNAGFSVIAAAVGGDGGNGGDGGDAKGGGIYNSGQAFLIDIVIDGNTITARSGGSAGFSGLGGRRTNGSRASRGFNRMSGRIP